MRFWLLFVLFFPGLVKGQEPNSAAPFKLILIGDAGLASVENAPYKNELDKIIATSAGRYAVVMLGDNIYPTGMPAKGERGRTEAEQVLLAQLQLLDQVKSPIFYLPGNHDWRQGRNGGEQHVLNQKQFFDSLRDSRIQFLPSLACPGPVEIPITENAVLVILDSQWFLHPWQKPEGENSTCDARTPSEFFVQLEDVFNRHHGKQLIVAAHHPLITYGDHGGVFTLKDHLFPLSDLNKNLLVPMPVLGSLYPLYRKWFGNIQDIRHPQYRSYIEAMQALLEKFPGIVYAAGHEHTLQYLEKKNVHYVVSGSGAKKSPVKKKKYSRFALSELGFAVVSVEGSQKTSVAYYTSGGQQFETSFRRQGDSIQAAHIDRQLPDSIEAIPSQRYAASSSHERWLGSNYRKEWSLPMRFPVFDLGKERGGLSILQTGGGMQTLSLRLKDSTGREYTLRSIEKYPEKAVPDQFKKTFAQDLVQDQISASHPYAAVVVPFLAKAAGIYHTNPEIVFVPDDPRLGIYQRQFANQLMLFEERPSGSGEGMDFFGNAKKIISTAKLLEELTADNDHSVDQKFVLRNRLFDLLIGDWDRHDDQWRWAEFDDKKGKRYRPIPRDRDQAFFVSEGIFPNIWSRKWALPKFQGFDDELNWPSGFMYNARYFDRSFLTGLTKEEWIRTAEDLVGSLSDEVIENAIRQWPSDIFDLRGQEVIRKLKSRRAKLAQYALDHYSFLAREVDVVGSKKREFFSIDHGGGSTHVKIYKLDKARNIGRLLFEREFFIAETEEIRIYGMGGDDQVSVTGKTSAIKIRVIGGDGNDQFDNQSDGRRKVFAYDVPDGVALSGRWNRQLSLSPAVNEYNRKAFSYDRLAPLVYANVNIDDGLFVGGGFINTKHGFRKLPYKSQHLVLGSVALNTASFNIKYDGRWMQAIGNWNVELDVDVKSPNYVNNFFGLGNETKFDKTIDERPGIREVENPIQYYRLRFKEYTAEARLSRKIGSYFFVKAGPAFQRVGIEDPENRDRYISVFAQAQSQQILERSFNYAGAVASVGVDKRDHPTLTTRGIYLHYTSRWMKNLDDAGAFESNVASLSLYHSFRLPARVTFAFRAGGGLTSGRYQFYQSQILDGKTELRGYRKTRFYGDQKIFFNHEIRWRLTSFRSYLFPASLGILGFYDVGRVWYQDGAGVDPSTVNGTSRKWHKGVGGGIWFTPFNMTALSTEVARSEEGTLAYIRLGFLF